MCSEYILVAGLPQQCYVILVHLPGVSHDNKIVTKRETLPEVIIIGIIVNPGPVDN